MTEIELTRAPTDRRLYLLDGVGAVRLEGWSGRKATAEADGRRWGFARRGFWQRAIQATDETGAVVGEFTPKSIRRGGKLRWGARELVLEPVGLRERYALSEQDRDLARLDAKGWGRRPVKITLADPHAIDPGLLLFAAFVVHLLAGDSMTAASAGSTAVASSGSYNG
ncbi:MAG: hypothetical protein QOJ43_2366 [Gaiellaceae bacterium]|jgi:hypothetical protein|nr:hypothetical protein [Gaiellaceae bacterium]